MSEELIQEKIREILINARLLREGKDIKIPGTPINKTPLDFLNNWLASHAATLEAARRIEAYIDSTKPKGIYCCYCGVYIVTDVTPLQYMAMSSLPPACDTCDRPAGTI